MTEESHRTNRHRNEPVSGRDPVSAPTQQTPRSEPAAPATQSASRKRKLLLAGAGTAIVAAVLAIAVPWITNALNTVSTDDAYVNGHVTFVAPRVRGQVARVLVDDNNRVRRGDVLVELDKEPYQAVVAIKRA